MNPLSLPTFSAGPTDTLAAIDVYGATADKTINSFIDKRDSASKFDVKSLLANGGRGAIGSAGSLLNKTASGGVSLNTSELTKRLTKAAPGITSSLREMSTSAQATIASAKVDSGLMDFKFGSDTFAINSANYADVTAFGDYANDVNTFSSSLATQTDSAMCYAYDVDSHASMIAGGIAQGSNLGIPKSYSIFTSNSTVNTNDSLLLKVATASVPILAKNADLGNLSAMAQGPGGQVFNAISPNYAGLIKSNYNYSRYGRNTGAQVNDYANLINVFTGADSRWNVIDRIGDATGTTGTETFNLVRLIGGSREFQELLAIGVKSLVDNSRDKYQGLASLFGVTTVDAEIKLFFPKVWQESFNNPQITKPNNSLDPRVIGLIGKATTAISNRVST